jgi:hypothetical protein
MRREVALAVVVLCLASSATGSAASIHDLYGWAKIGKPVVGVSKVGLAYGVPVARHVPPGRYRLHVAAQSDLAFHLLGPGIDRQTRFTPEWGARIYATWTIRLRRGSYRYSGEGLFAKELGSAGVPTRGSFTVP